MSSELVIQTMQTPGTVAFYNYEEVKLYLHNNLAFYAGVVYDSVAEAEEDKKALSLIQRKLKQKKKEIEESYSQPFEVVRKQLDELIEIVNEPLKNADKYIKENEKAEKKERIYEYAEKRASSVLGAHAQQIIQSPVFFNSRWLNKSYKDAEWRNDINELIEHALIDLSVISGYDAEVSRILEARYFETLSMSGIDRFIEHAAVSRNEHTSHGNNEEFKSENDTASLNPPPILSNPSDPDMYGIIKICGTRTQLNNIVRQFQIMGVQYQIIEKGYVVPVESDCY